jgi:hypothetical protein
VTENMPEHDDMLRALGLVVPPDPAVLDAARAVLWSAVAAEMLATRPPGGSRRGRAAGPEHEHRRRDEPGL